MKRWFAPKLIGLHVTAVVLLFACVWMGRWQLGVYGGKQDGERNAQSELAPVPIDSIWGPNTPFLADDVDRRVSVTGEFAPTDQQVWVTNKDDGVWLLAPVKVDDSYLLVVRGWAPEPTAFPVVPAGEVTFDGVLRPGDDAGSTAFDPQTRSAASVRIPELLNVLDVELWSGYVISSSTEISGGLDLAEPPPPDVSWTAGGRNLGYGLQWWAFAAFVVFMWWRMARETIADSVDE